MESELPDDVLSDEPVMPEIPIKPNNAIPITIGVLLILGSLLVLFGAAGELYTHSSERSDTYYEQMADTFSIAGIETDAAEVEEWDTAFQDANYHLVYGLLLLISGLAVGTAGVLFIMKKEIAIKVGGGAAAAYVLLGVLVPTLWANSIESDIGISMETSFGTLELVLGIVCSLTCLALPLLPMLIPAGRAALD